MLSDRNPRTVKEAAAELNVSVSTVRAWVAQRRLGCVREPSESRPARSTAF